MRGLMELANRRNIVKGSYPAFKAINYIPGPREFQGPQGEPGTTFTPVYGSLYANSQMLAESTTNVSFDTVGPSSRITLNITDDSITVNSPGVYTITFSTVLLISGDQPDPPRIISFVLSINGTPDFNKHIEFHNYFNQGEINTLSRTDQLLLNQGDVIRYFIPFTTSNNFYTAALVVTKVA